MCLLLIGEQEDGGAEEATRGEGGTAEGVGRTGGQSEDQTGQGRETGLWSGRREDTLGGKSVG